MVRARTDPDEVRARILKAAEERFRSIGYDKTSVADIASELRMSPANVYRFFLSSRASPSARRAASPSPTA